MLPEPNISVLSGHHFDMSGVAVRQGPTWHLKALVRGGLARSCIVLEAMNAESSLEMEAPTCTPAGLGKDQKDLSTRTSSLTYRS